jgi:hypothetical protein
MRVQRISLESIPRDAYDRLTGDSFFASRGFLRLWAALGGRVVVWTAEVEGEIGAVVPAIEYGAHPIKRLVSLPDGCYGGIHLAPGLEHERSALRRALLGAIARHPYARTSIFDFLAATGPHPAFSAARCEAVLVDISDPDWQPPDRKIQSQIRKAMREGIRVEPFDWARHRRSFLQLVETAARHHGQRPRYPQAFYRSLAELSERDSRVRWLHCERDGRAAASHIYFVERDTLQAWQSYFDRRFSFLKPNQYIRFWLTRGMARRGIHWLNLGATPAGATGLAYYKARWGGRRITFSSYTRWDGLGSVIHGLRSRAWGSAVRPGAVTDPDAPIETPWHAG